MAARCLEEVLALEPEAETDFEVLEVILRARSDDERLAQVMRRRAAAGHAPKRRDRLLALAELIYARDPAEAAAVLAEAVKLDPTSVPALVRLAEVEAELGRSAEAIATYRRAIAASPDPRVVSAAWVRIGDIAERALADGDQAVDAYRNALLSTPDDLPRAGGPGARPVAPARLRRTRRSCCGAWRRSSRIATRASATWCARRAAGGARRGSRGRGRRVRAGAGAASAARPGDGPPRRDADRARRAVAAGGGAGPLPGGRARRARARMRLAALWSGPLGSSARAIDELRIVVAADDGDVEARAELARVLEAADRLPEAIAEHLALLRARAAAGRVAAGAAPAVRARGPAAPRARAAAALAALGLDRRRRRARRARGAPALDARDDRDDLPRADFDAIIRHPDARHPATALLAAMSEVLPRLYGLALEDWGVTKQDRLAPRSEDPQRALVSRVAALLGVEDTFDVFQARAIATQVEIEAGPPPALLLPPNFAALPRQEAYLQLGPPARTPARRDVRGRAHPGEGPGPPGRGRRPHGLPRLRARHPARGAAERRGAEDRAHAAAAAPARVRAGGAVVPRRAASSTATGGAPAIVHTGHRARDRGSGDVLGAFEQLARGDRRLAAAVLQPPEELLAAARASAAVVELINFAVGDELATLNRRLGVD